MIDLDTLEIAKDSYVAQDLRGSFSDLFYRVGNGTSHSPPDFHGNLPR